MGVACGANKLLYVTPQVTLKMLEFPVGVSCGANKFLYVTPQIILSRYFWLWVTRRGNKLKHVGPTTMEIIENDKHKCTRGAPNKHLRKLKLCRAESQICATANSKNA